jgi:PIN domain nuclease of toxin-antitoxin system
MRLLLDSHILLWFALEPHKLPESVARVLRQPQNEPCFSVASIWELAIKQASGRANYVGDAAKLRSGLLASGYAELAVTGEHALRTMQLPPIHKDPFDRLMIAQAQVERMVLVTNDAVVMRYPDLSLL